MDRVKKIEDEIFLNRVDLPDNSLKFLNSYIIKSQDKTALVDTGMNNPVSFNSLIENLTSLKIEKLDYIIITHLHNDHIGLLEKIYNLNKNAKILIFKKERETIGKMLERFENEEETKNYLEKLGFDKETLKVFSYWKMDLDPYNLVMKKSETLDEGTIKIGNSEFNVIWTPGHTPGHMCLLHKSSNKIICGDHILKNITPNISFLYEENNLLDYFRSLDKVKNIDPDLILPGHNGFIKNVKERIEELGKHHVERLDEVLRILENKEMNLYEIASRMTWSSKNDFMKMDSFQKYMALGEAMAHVIYLENENLVERIEIDGKIKFRILKKN